MDSPTSHHSLQPTVDDHSHEHSSEVSSLTEHDLEPPQAVSAEPQTPEPPVPSIPPSPVLSRRTSENHVSDSEELVDEAQPESTNDHGEAASEASPPEAGKWATLVADTWILELIAGFVSFGALASIVGVLWSYDNKPVPALMKGITLNAVISFLATISRTAIMLCISTVLSQGKWLWFKKEHTLMDLQNIENASQGPLGSSLLLAKWKGGPVLYLAALLTIITLGFDPFVQQLLTIQTRIVPEPGLGISINAVHSLSQAFANEDQTAHVNMVDAQLVAATLADVGNATSGPSLQARRSRFKRLVGTTQTISPLTPNCPGGNCIWDPYYALDICTQCRDTTAESTLVISPSSNFSTPAAAGSYAWEGALNSPRQNTSAQMTWDLIPKTGNRIQVSSNVSCLIEYDDGSVTGSTNNNAMMWTYFIQRTVWPLNIAVEDGSLSFPLTYLNWTNGEFANISDPVAAIGFAEFGLAASGGLVLEQSLECALTYCVKEFNRSVIQGSLISNILSESYGNTVNGGGTNQTWSTVVNGTEWTTADTVDGVDESLYGAGVDNMVQILLGSSTNYYYVLMPDTAETLANLTIDWANATQPTVNESKSIPETWQGIAFTEDFTTVLENTNAIMSDIMQQMGNISVTGNLAVTKSFVVVRWPWIALPGTVILVGLFLFGLIVWKTRRLDAPKWSSSLLPLLYRHAPIDGHNPTTTTIGADSVANKEARSMTVTSLDGSNLVSRFEVEAEATTLRFSQVGPESRIWQLQSVEVVYKDEKSWWRRLKWW